MGLIISFAVAATLTPVVARVARRIGIVDQPGPLKVHDRPVPYLGGVAVFAALAGPAASGRPTLLLPLALALALGLADDVVELSPRARLACEVGIGVAAAVVVPARGWVGALVTVVLVVALLNAVNLLDGLDGLASGVGLVSALGFAVVLDGDSQALALALAGGLGGFLVWNRPPARIYLGDAGSYLAGTALALLLAVGFGDGQPVALTSACLLFVAVPVADTTVAIVRRLRGRRPLLQGDRGHVYDQLVDRGWGAPATSAACVAVQAALVTAGLGVAALPALGAAATSALVIMVVGIWALWAFTSPASWSR